MVASSAIIDYGLDVRTYFMMNAAVPLEAYDGQQSNRRMMVHKDDWLEQDGADYAERLLSPNWYQLFFPGHQVFDESGGSLFTIQPNDRRYDLRWESRFSNFPPGVEFINFYSSGERKTPAEADLIPYHSLILEPFFRPFKDGDSDFPTWGNGEWLYGDTSTANTHLPELPAVGSSRDSFKNHAKVLSEAIPAHSDPTGSSAVPTLGVGNNIDLDAVYMDPGLWPQSRLTDTDPDNNGWLHSDYKEPAYIYVRGLYDELINRGGLNQ